jgi:hypothetical protein
MERVLSTAILILQFCNAIRRWIVAGIPKPTRQTVIENEAKFIFYQGFAALWTLTRSIFAALLRSGFVQATGHRLEALEFASAMRP